MQSPHLFAALVLSASAVAAQAQSPAMPTAVEPAAPASAWRIVGQAGYSFGGDTLASGHYTSGESYSIKAGGGVLVSGGVEYALSPALALQATVGWQWDSTNGSNGNIEFTRFPVELLGLYALNPQWRVGVGLRSATGAKLKPTGVARDFVDETSYDSTPGAVFEVQYLFGAAPQTVRRGQMGLTLRYVAESFKAQPTGTKFKGDHLGLGFVTYF